MALESTFRELSSCLQQLQDALNVIEVTLGDKPPNDESAVADGVETIVLDILGTLHEVRQAALETHKAIGHPMDLDLARHALMRCQDGFHRIEEQFASQLVSYEQLKELARLGSARRTWQPWANTVRQEIEQCQPSLHETSKALAGCWQELVEHSGKTSISIRTENLGQKIYARGTRETVGSSAT
jgi:hypothetical protein